MQLGDHEAARPPPRRRRGEVVAHDEHLVGVVVAIAHDPLHQPAHAVGEVGERELETAVAPGDAAAAARRPRARGARRAAPGSAARRCRRPRGSPRGCPRAAGQDEAPAPAIAAADPAGEAHRGEVGAHRLDGSRQALVLFVGHQAALDQAGTGRPQNVRLGAVGEQQEEAAFDVGPRAEAGIDDVDPRPRHQGDVDAERGQALDAGAQLGGRRGVVGRRRRPLQAEDTKGAAQQGLCGIGGSRLHLARGRRVGRVIPAPGLSYARRPRAGEGATPRNATGRHGS